MSANALTGISIKNFTAFEELDLDFSPGVNMFIGLSSAGKAHPVKLMYGVRSSPRLKNESPEEKSPAVFTPRGEIKPTRPGKSSDHIPALGFVEEGTSSVPPTSMPCDRE
jgi:hypothetical protein